MNDREMMEARLRERRGEIRVVPNAAETPESKAVDSGQSVEKLADLEMRRLLTKATDEKTSIAIMKVAVAYLAVKHKLGPEIGADLDLDKDEA